MTHPQTTRIVFIGECMVEMAPQETSGTYKMGFAGDTLNTAWYLARLLGDRAEVSYYTAVGRDAVSDQMLGYLASQQIETTSILRRDDRTLGLYMIQLHEGERSFNYWRSHSAARTLAQSLSDVTAALEGAQIAYFSGITLAILSAADRETLFEALARFAKTGGQVVFDPNLRPALWSDPDTMRAAVMQAAALSDTVLPSHEDEATWFGDTSLEDTAARYAQAGAATIIVKNGADTMLIADGPLKTMQAPQQVATVVDTTAAGDSFNAGYLASRIAGLPIDQSVATGAALAARVVSERGALVASATDGLILSPQDG